ncbi:beta-glucosidase [Enterococcus sp. PF1-24]|uniref:glycoside hydrolase family 3 N-terminal domain-containing protein n=1 Tax=unclassified Enterococcus TaxID=2608891 RepID=UPI002473C366|nr:MULTISPECIES: glycoside hydrolase family 3 N-terminal domain-containing protein [unclassified Enterococcus]MDH6365488.1 beta-glucosidase [Enterococcus sp. PFB1-1]MDH6402589.1 beta-glucosidase [Enterococcus sp. PF1-24]
MKKFSKYVSLFSVPLLLAACSQNGGQTEESKESEAVKYTVEEKKEGDVTYLLVTNPNDGAVLGYLKDGGVSLLEETSDNATYAFKDMNGNEKLDVWEDWRKDVDARAKSLSEELTKEQIAGLMLFSSHERNPEDGLTEDQQTYLKDSHLRNVLNAGGNDVTAAVNWNNEMQAYVEELAAEEGSALLPVNFSSDPRSTAGSDAAYNAEGDDISRWPSNLGLAATFNPDTMLTFSKAASEEYRAMGIATALGPQIELATEPRWLRVDGTFGENTALATDMAKAYADGSQSSFDADGNDLGWGKDSIHAMVKHFPGDGMGEGGREAHMNSGKYAVYPGENFEEHLIPFLDGAMNLDGKTEAATAVMSSYSIAIDKDGNPLFGTEMGSAYDKDKIDILRKDNNYEGVICTDWAVTSAPTDPTNLMGLGTAWGAEKLTIPERHFEILKTGVDMFGGNNDIVPVLEAYDMWDEAYEKGDLEITAEERFRQSGERLVKMLMLPGSFENPYLSLEESTAIVGSEDKRTDGYQAQLDSIIMLKNEDETITASKDVEKDFQDKVVYIPSSIHNNFATVFGEGNQTAEPTMNVEIAENYFKEVLTDEPVKDGDNVTGFKAPDLKNVDMIIVGMSSPDNGSPFSSAGLQDGEAYPLSLQYGTYTADGEHVRKDSISGDTKEDGTKENRSYFGKTSTISNSYDLEAFQNAQKQAAEIEKETGKKIPVIVVLKAKNPVIVSEFEKDADAIVTGFSVSDQAYFDIILGKQEPQGLLPMQFPADMDTVEAQLEDVGQDMTPYKDSVGNSYDFGYGLNYKGVISDERTKKYVTE